ncbi:MAG: ATPase [Muribaculaceae bacterium]|nr:ATPase [Muribaculaceae bacterium]
MILIADCGSTKVDWCVVRNGKVEKQVFTCGMNAVMLTEEEMRTRIAAELVPELGERAAGIEAVYFYGAGCISPEVCGNVARAISANIPSAGTVEVHTDLLAAARALCGRRPGIACILGTGSNSCYYDGSAIAMNVSPLGFILGDEGSGAVLGKLLVGDVLKAQLPADLCEKFLHQYDLTLLDIIRRVYKEPQPNRFLASVTPFLIENIDRAEVRALVQSSFEAFFRRNVSRYAGMCEPCAHFVGSIAHYYREVLADAAAATGFTVGTILKSPMEGLIQFHS